MVIKLLLLMPLSCQLDMKTVQFIKILQFYDLMHKILFFSVLIFEVPVPYFYIYDLNLVITLKSLRPSDAYMHQLNYHHCFR